MTPSKSSFRELLETHNHLDEIFLCHQEALISKDLARAHDLLLHFESELKVHMSFEEQELLPLYQTVPHVQGSGADLYLAEHRKIREMLAQIGDRLDGIDSASHTLEREIISLIEQETTFKSLMNHDLRERKFLYPMLDGLTTEAERQVMIAGHARDCRYASETCQA